MIDFPTSSNAAPSPSGVHAAVRLRRLAHWMRRYWWIPALTIMAGLGIVDYLSLHKVDRYFSYSQMMVSGRITLPQGQMYTEGDELANFYGTQVALMKSSETYNQAVDRVTASHPEVSIDPNAEIDAGVELRTSIFDLKVTSTDPAYARLLLDAVMDTYLSGKREWKNQTTDEAVSAITEEIAHLDAEIRTDEQQLLDFQKENNVVFIEEQSNAAATYLVSLNRDLARLIKEHDLLALESKDPIAQRSQDDTTPPPSSGDSDIALDSSLPADNENQDSSAILAEQDRIEKLKILRDQYGLYLKDAHPKMIDLSDSIDKEQKFLELLKTRNKTTQDAHSEDMELQIKNLQQQITIWNTKSLELSQRLGTYQELKSKITREQGLYNQLASSIQNVDLTKSIDQEDVVILAAASHAIPIKPNDLLHLLYGFGGGLAVGLAIVFCLVRFDDKIDSLLELEQNLEFPIAGQIPLARLDRKTRRVPLLSEDDSRHDFLEHHRDIRSSILFPPSSGASPRSIMICSAVPGEGKSTLAANLAATFAFCGARVLLIDADLRRGVLHSTFDLPVGPGLAEFLQGELSWPEAVQSTHIPNLDFIPRGKVPSRAGDLLLRAPVDLLLQQSAAAYDFVIWDTPPLFAAHDAANICSKVDAVLFLARVRHSSVSLVRSALENLAQKNAKVFGIVLNAVAPGQPGYYNKYRYKEYSGAAATIS